MIFVNLVKFHACLSEVEFALLLEKLWEGIYVFMRLNLFDIKFELISQLFNFIQILSLFYLLILHIVINVVFFRDFVKVWEQNFHFSDVAYLAELIAKHE